MADISLSAIYVCILAVDDTIVKLEALLVSGAEDNSADLQELIFSYEKTALELKQAYKKEWKPTINLPSYEKLMEGRFDRWEESF